MILSKIVKYTLVAALALIVCFGVFSKKDARCAKCKACATFICSHN